jgi:hypothetical protein
MFLIEKEIPKISYPYLKLAPMNPGCVVRSVEKVTPCHGWLIQAVNIRDTRRTSGLGNPAVLIMMGRNCWIIIACARWLIAKWFSNPSSLRPGE